MRESLTVGGRLRVTLRDPETGQTILDRHFDNLVTLAGRTLLAEILTGAAVFKDMEMAVGGPASAGEQTAEPQLTDVALANELAVVKAVPEPEPPTEQQVAGQMRMVKAISGTLAPDPGGSDLAMTEAGIKITKQDDSKVLYNRVVFPTITKQASLQMTLTWEVLF